MGCWEPDVYLALVSGLGRTRGTRFPCRCPQGADIREAVSQALGGGGEAQAEPAGTLGPCAPGLSERKSHLGSRFPSEGPSHQRALSLILSRHQDTCPPSLPRKPPCQEPGKC